MTFNNQLVDKFLDAVFPLPAQFGVSEDDMPDCICFFESAVKEVDPAAYVKYGVSKIAILSPNLNGIVIKIPFNGFYYYEYNEDGDDEEAEDIEVWEPFCWANGSDESDYCLAEYEKYQKLKTQKLDCFVAEVIYYKTIDNTRIFLQEEITPDHELNHNSLKKPSKKSRKIADKWYRKRKFDINPNWIASCLDKYGQAKVKRFLKYCNTVDEDILEDAHSGNFGYRKNGTPCILDYSNFND